MKKFSLVFPNLRSKYTFVTKVKGFVRVGKEFLVGVYVDFAEKIHK